MSLVLATLDFPPRRGGIEQLCAELARELSAAGVELAVVAPRQPGDAAFDARVAYRVQRYTPDRLRHLRLAREVLALVRSGHDRVLFGQWTAAGAYLAGAFGARARLACLGHAKEFLSARSGLRSTPPFAAYRRAVLARMHPVFAVSAYTAERARAAGATRVSIVHPGVDTERFTPRASAALPAELAAPCGPLLLTVARLVPRKGIDTVLEALPELVRAHPGLRYFVAGDGPDRARLEALAAARRLAEHVRFLGAVPSEHLPSLCASADLFLLASRQDLATGDVEGFGLVLLEAQASGTPVVATDSGGMRDAFLPGETGVLVPAQSPIELGRQLAALLSDPERLSRMGHAARAHAEARSWRASAARIAAELEP